MPRATAGNASRMNNHCQPWRPPSPCISRSALDSGEPSTTEIGTAAMNSEVMVARRREPVAEIQDDAGKEARLRRAEQEAQRVEARGVPQEGHRRRDKTPGDHHPRDPQPRADLVEDDVRRHFEEEITPEEDPGAE